MTQTLVLAAVDRRLRHRTVRVLAYMAGHCAGEDYRRMKHTGIARALGMNRAGIARDLAALVELGYLEQGPLDGRIGSYRLATRPWGSPPPASQCAEMDQSRSA